MAAYKRFAAIAAAVVLGSHTCCAGSLERAIGDALKEQFSQDQATFSSHLHSQSSVSYPNKYKILWGTEFRDYEDVEDELVKRFVLDALGRAFRKTPLGEIYIDLRDELRRLKHFEYAKIKGDKPRLFLPGMISRQELYEERDYSLNLETTLFSSLDPMEDLSFGLSAVRNLADGSVGIKAYYAVENDAGVRVWMQDEKASLSLSYNTGSNRVVLWFSMPF